MSLCFEPKIQAVYVPPVGQPHWWSLMMDHEMRDEAFSLDHIQPTGPNRQQLAVFIGMLDQAGIIRSIGEVTATGRPLYRVVHRQAQSPQFTRDGVLLPPSITARQALWNAMRSPFFRAGFQLNDIAVHASTDTLTVTQNSARQYIFRLTQAGYLAKVQKGSVTTPAVWRLIRNTGPQAPKIIQSAYVYDPNSRSVAAVVKTTEVQP